MLKMILMTCAKIDLANFNFWKNLDFIRIIFLLLKKRVLKGVWKSEYSHEKKCEIRLFSPLPPPTFPLISDSFVQPHPPPPPPLPPAPASQIVH